MVNKQTIKQMEKITTNQIKQFAKSNQYIQEYLNTDSYDISNSFYMKLGKSPIFKDNRISVATAKANGIYAKAWDEIKWRFGNKFVHYNEYFTTNLFDLTWKFNVRIQITGETTIVISSCSTDDNKTFYKLPFFENSYTHKFEYNGILSENRFIDAVKFEIEKQLYPEGLFRKIQLSLYKTISDCKMFYLKAQCEQRRVLNGSVGVDWDDISKWALKRLKLDLSNFDYPEKKVMQFLRKCKGYENVVILFPSPNVYEVLDEMDEDVDIEEFYYSYLKENYPENTVFC